MIRMPTWDNTYPAEKKLTDDYAITINGKTCEVRECRVSAMPFNIGWPGHQRPLNQSEIASYILVSSDEMLDFEVTCKRAFKKAVIRPLSKGIDPEREEDVLRFTLEKPGQYVLELDSDHFALHIFFNPIKEYPDKEKATYYFGPGLHFPRLIRLKDNDSIYVDEGAVVYTSILGEGVKNIHIYGGGVLDGGMEERVYEHCYQNYHTGNIRLYDSENITIEDVVLKDSAVWVLSTFDCDNITIDNIKIVGQWRYNTDGIDLCNTSNVTIKNSFIRAFDDVITIKGLYHKEMTIQNILVENCVMWCGWGRNAEIGLETSATEYKDIIFRNCDLIHNCHVAIDIQNGNHAEIHHITYENINVEYQLTQRTPIGNDEEHPVYTGGNKTYVPQLICSINPVFPYFSDVNNPDLGYTHDILYKNIRVDLPEGVEMPEIVIWADKRGKTHKNFTIDGLYVNGEKQENLDRFKTTFDNVENIVIK